jgi:hypothetical protein
MFRGMRTQTVGAGTFFLLGNRKTKFPAGLNEAGFGEEVTVGDFSVPVQLPYLGPAIGVAHFGFSDTPQGVSRPDDVSSILLVSP